MERGKLNSRVTIQRQSTTQDEIGQSIPNWENVATLWAKVQNTSGIEAIKSGADTSIVKASIRIDYRTDIDSKMRVIHGSTTYNIKAVLPDAERKQYLDLSCEVIV